MATLAAQQATPTGLNPAYVAAAGGGDSIEVGPTVFLHVKNGSGASITVTVNSIAACNQGFDHDLAVAVPAAGERMIGPITADRYAGSNGYASVTYSGVTSLTVAVVKL